MNAPTPPERAVTVCRTDYTLGRSVQNLAMQHPNGVVVEVRDGETGDVVGRLRTPTRHELAPTPAPRVQQAPLAPVFVMPQPASEPDIDDLDAEDEDAEVYVAESGIEPGDGTVYDPRSTLPLTEKLRLAGEGLGYGKGGVA